MSRGVLLKSCSLKFCKIHRKTQESLFLINLQVSGARIYFFSCNFIKKRQAFSCEFREICKNKFLYARPVAAFQSLTYYVKSVRVESFSGLHFPAFGFDTERYSVSLEHLSVIGPNAGKQGPKKLIIWTFFMQLLSSDNSRHYTV